MQLDVAKTNRVDTAPTARPARDRQRFQSTQNFRRVIEIDLIGDSRLKHRPIHFAARLDHQRKIFFADDRGGRSEEHTSELPSPDHLVFRLLLSKKKKKE